jgi:NADPH:quinone reductase
MRAVVTEDYGSGPTLADVSRPEPGPGEIRVKVHCSSLNGFDIAMAAGYLKGLMEHRFPAVLGRDFAGTVDEVGDGVSAFAPGDDVFGVVLTQPLTAGAFADYVVMPEDHNVAHIPFGLNHATAGVLGLAGAAATAALGAVAPQAGETVVVSGATGGVGAVVLQLASAAGITSIATALPGEETDHVRALGATYVVDRGRDLAEQIRALAPGGIDCVLHFAGDPFALADLLVDGGRFASLLGIGPEHFADRPITASSVYATPHRGVLDSLAAQVLDGRLRIPVQRTYDLPDVPAAFNDFAAGTLGKLAVSI